MAARARSSRNARLHVGRTMESYGASAAVMAVGHYPPGGGRKVNDEGHEGAWRGTQERGTKARRHEGTEWGPGTKGPSEANSLVRRGTKARRHEGTKWGPGTKGGS